MPAAMGLALASYVLCFLAGQPIELGKNVKASISANLVHKLHARLEARERRDNGIEYVHCSSFLGSRVA